MENCFRFLINVDQCLNMSHFDIFFYKLENRHKYHLNQVSLFGKGANDSLKTAITDIRMYLDKYPYHVGDYQIIVAMRSAFCKEALRWEQTLLYRLLQLDHELRNARIYLNSRERVEKALNLIMLYDADFSVELPELGEYMSSHRFLADCHMLLGQLGIQPEQDGQEQLQQRLQTYVRGDHDAAAASVLQRFLESLDAREELVAKLDEESAATVTHAGALSAELAAFLKDLLTNYQVFEAAIDRNNRRQNIMALLRTVEFINMSVAQGKSADGSTTLVSLAQRCRANWQTVWNDPQLEQRYAVMLHRYKQRLNLAANELEQPKFVTPTAQKLPEEKIPQDNAISGTEGVFSSSDPQKQGNDLRQILRGFAQNKFSVKSVIRDWDDVYQRLKQALEKMDHELRVYAEDLSRQYAAVLEERKRQAIAWRNNHYTADKDIEKDISGLEYAREQCLQKLKSPHMNPTLSFQDQLNMENSLEQTNLLLQFLVRCMNAVRVVSFLALVGCVMGLCFLHYTVLQPYVLQNAEGLGYYLLYLAIALVGMLLCWGIPYDFFRGKVKKAVEALAKDMELYINGYFEKADHFRESINLLNQLDYINRYYRLLVQAHSASNKLSQSYLWHKVQIRDHLTKLQFFQGLIELDPLGELNDELGASFLDSVGVRDVVDTPLYWPQG